METSNFNNIKIPDDMTQRDIIREIKRVKVITGGDLYVINAYWSTYLLKLEDRLTDLILLGAQE